MTTMLGGCTCYGEAPTVPTYRDRMTHLDDCPARHSGFPVGILSPAPLAPSSAPATALHDQRHQEKTMTGQTHEPELAPSEPVAAWRAEFYGDVGSRLRLARKRRRMTQDDVARELDISRASYANVEAGRQRVNVCVMWKLAVVLAVPLAELVPAPIRR